MSYPQDWKERGYWRWRSCLLQVPELKAGIKADAKEVINIAQVFPDSSKFLPDANISIRLILPVMPIAVMLILTMRQVSRKTCFYPPLPA